MPEMPHAGEHHGKPGLIGSLNHLIISDRTTWLDNGGSTGRGRDF
jgi:hypothetical protein